MLCVLDMPQPCMTHIQFSLVSPAMTAPGPVFLPVAACETCIFLPFSYNISGLGKAAILKISMTHDGYTSVISVRPEHHSFP